MASFDENGKYIKTNWKAGDRITATKLNKIEESIEAVNDNDISRHVEADTRLDALEAKDVAHDKELTKIKNTIADNKAAAELGDYDINSRMTFLENELNEGIEEVHNVVSTVDGKIATAEANMTAQVNQGKADMEAMVAEVEADLEGLHAKDEEITNELRATSIDVSKIAELSEIRLTKGVYELFEPLVLYKGQRLIMSCDATLEIMNDVDGVILEFGASITGGVIKTNIENYSKSLLKVVPAINSTNNVNIDYRTRVSDMSLVGKTYHDNDSCVGINIEDANGQGLCFLSFNNILIRNVHTGILLHGDNETTWINGNNFSNIDMFGVRKGIVCDCGFESTGNKFDNIQMQTPSNYICSVELVRNAHYNTFSIFTWDKVVDTDSIIFAANTSNNIVYDNNNSSVSDLGTNNEVIVNFKDYTRNSNSYKTIDLRDLDNDKSYPIVFHGPIDIDLYKVGSPSAHITAKCTPCSWDYFHASHNCFISALPTSNLIKKVYMQYQTAYVSIYLRGGYNYKYWDHLNGMVDKLNRLYSAEPLIVTDTFTDSTGHFNVSVEDANSQIPNGLYVGFESTLVLDSTSTPSIE